MQLLLLMHVIFLVQFIESYFQSLSISANLNVTSGYLIICGCNRKNGCSRESMIHKAVE